MQFLTTNNLGGYLWYIDTSLSRYQGWFLLIQGQMIKILDAIEGEHIQCDTPLFSNTLVIEHKGKEARLLFDIRKSYENPQWGRFFTFTQKDNILWVRYSLEPSLVIGICQDDEYKEIGDWKESYYPFDAKRHSPPFSQWVYQGIACQSKRISISVGFSEAEVRQELSRMRYHHAPARRPLQNAYKEAQHSLLRLRVYNKHKEIQGLYGGLPWFFQFWSRDMAIASRAFSFFSPKETVYLLSQECSRSVCPSYRELDNHVSKLASADGKMLVQLRMQQLGIQESWQEYENTEFMSNQEKETWMDTISRAGARIELQALKLALLRNTSYENSFLQKVRDHFIHQGVLIDGLHPDGSFDTIKRPNVFLAAYIYPHLLSLEEWEYTIDQHLEALWLSWGGIATLDIRHADFYPVHSGEINRDNPYGSYHQGDSWFWINNITALVLHRLNPHKYMRYIKKIVAASTQDILKKGIPGHASELSSASQFSPAGSPVQLWSAATYIELSREIHS